MSNPEQEIGLITQVRNFIGEHPVATLGVSFGVALSAAGFKSPNVIAQSEPAGSAQSDSDYTSDEWPAMDQKIDGAEERWEGSAGAEQLYADDCKDLAVYKAPQIAKMNRTSNGRSMTLTTKVKAGSIAGCDGYGRRTSRIWTESKRSANSKVVRGIKFIIRNNHTFNESVKLDIDRSCPSTGSLLVRIGSTNSYEHIDASKKTFTPKKTAFKKVTC